MQAPRRPQLCPPRRAAGFSLVELMVGLALSLVVMAALSMLYANNSRARDEAEKTNAEIENGRYASTVLAQELTLAGYWGEFNPTALSAPGTLPDPVNDATNPVPSMPIAVQGFHDGRNGPGLVQPSAALLALMPDLRSQSDVLVLRRASTCGAGPTTPATGCSAMDSTHRYLQTTLCANQLSVLSTLNQFVVTSTASLSVFNSNNPAVTIAPTYLTQHDCVTPAVTRSFFERVYYVANDDQPGDGIPTLKMIELGVGTTPQTGFNTPVSLAQGIDTMQLEYGLDLNGDGAPDVYTADPSNPAYLLPLAGSGLPITYPGVVAAWMQVTAVKVHLLARTTQQSPGFVDTRRYVMGSVASTDNTFGPFNDGYKRHVYSHVNRLVNVAERLE